MKRYQCIKNYYVGPHPAFSAGSVYPFFTIENTDLLGVVDNFGTTHIVDEELGTIFHELIDLNVDQMEEEEYRMLVPDGSLTRGCAVAIAIIITVIILMLSI
jgi:hypothetical protein